MRVLKTGQLRKSSISSVAGDSVVIGTNIVYGGRKKTPGGVVFERAHTRKIKLPWDEIPAREYMVLQQRDVLEIEGLMAGIFNRGRVI
jgi:phage gpG-like protein